MTLEDQARLRRIQLVLAILICLVAVAGRRYSTWPFIAWPVFCTWDGGAPGPSHSLFEAVVVDRDGRTHVLAEGRDVFPMDRKEILRRAVRYTFEVNPHQDAWRAYLIELVSLTLKDVKPVVIEGWRIDWDVDVTALPPLQRESPRARVKLGAVELNGST